MRHTRQLFHARIEYLRHNPYSTILDESHSYDMNDTIDTMMAFVKHRFPADLGYRCDFDPNTLSYSITKFDWAFATIKLISSDDGIDLL
jgi:hypothetical protein